MALKKSKSCRRKSCRRKQSGGQSASSCVAKPDLSKYLNAACYQANLHNTNPEAGDLSLAQGAGFLPGLAGGAKMAGKPGLAGGANCKNNNQTGGQCSEPGKPVTFAEYKESVKKYLGVLDQFGGVKCKKGKCKKSKKAQAGGTYFSINPEEMIGGLPRVDKGDSCCHGAILGGKFVQGDSGRAISGNQVGAGSRKTKKRRQTRRMRGGSSEPASFPDAFVNENGNFSPDASDKDFSCRQPFWGPKCR
jgi:hypothetical protein